MSSKHSEDYLVSLSEIQTLNSEKRTRLSELRTGIAVATVPLSIFTVLIATSRFYQFEDILAIVTLLAILCGILLILGFYYIIRSFLGIRTIEKRLKQTKGKLSF
ncbi:MAG: hypothetical protein ACE5OY_09105 [Candidatus Bathyarchaeia archaeon]